VHTHPIQEKLYSAGYDMLDFYKKLEPVTAEVASTASWREAARPGVEVSESTKTAVLGADKLLEERNPVHSS
jgi:hypothetical protein